MVIGNKHFKTAPDTALVQECIEGEEYTVGITGTPDDAQALPIMQIVNVKAVLFDWQEKYESDGSNEVSSLDNIDPELAGKTDSRIASNLLVSQLSRCCSYRLSCSRKRDILPRSKYISWCYRSIIYPKNVAKNWEGYGRIYRDAHRDINSPELERIPRESDMLLNARRSGIFV
jgi:hypothetical protein